MGQGSPFMLYAVIGAVVLGLALAYAMLRNRKRTPSERAAADAATREGYDPNGASKRPDLPDDPR